MQYYITFNIALIYCRKSNNFCLTQFENYLTQFDTQWHNHNVYQLALNVGLMYKTYGVIATSKRPRSFLEFLNVLTSLLKFGFGTELSFLVLTFLVKLSLQSIFLDYSNTKMLCCEHSLLFELKHSLLFAANISSLQQAIPAFLR